MIYEHYNSGIPIKLNADAVTFSNHIFYKDKKEDVVENLRVHEMVHVKQFEEYGVLKFLSKYIREYLRGRISGLNHNDSYLQISLEIEAYEAQYRFVENQNK